MHRVCALGRFLMASQDLSNLMPKAVQEARSEASAGPVPCCLFLFLFRKFSDFLVPSSGHKLEAVALGCGFHAYVSLRMLRVSLLFGSTSRRL